MSNDEKHGGLEIYERERYERERTAWLRVHAPELADRDPLHSCTVQLPGGSPARLVVLEEFTSNGVICGAFGDAPCLHAFSSVEQVLVAASRRAVDDPWLQAACAALARERTWTHCGRRWTLSVWRGSGELFHGSAAANRESIRRHGPCATGA